MKKRYSGEIRFGDNCRCAGENELNGSIHIGGVDVISDLVGFFPSKARVTVGLADKRFEGPLAVETGWGYSEYTPMEADALLAGENDVIAILSKQFQDGDKVTLWISDEPINLIDAEGLG